MGFGHREFAGGDRLRDPRQLVMPGIDAVGKEPDGIEAQRAVVERLRIRRTGTRHLACRQTRCSRQIRIDRLEASRYRIVDDDVGHPYRHVEAQRDRTEENTAELRATQTTTS